MVWKLVEDASLEEIDIRPLQGYHPTMGVWPIVWSWLGLPDPEGVAPAPTHYQSMADKPE